MGENDDTTELHWGGLLWQRGRDGAFFLRDPERSDLAEETIEGAFGADATLEDACGAAYREEDKRLQRHCRRYEKSAQDVRGKWTNVPTLGCPLNVPFGSALVLALDLVEEVPGKGYSYKVGLNQEQFRQLGRDCVSMVPSPLPIQKEKAAALARIQKHRNDAEKLLANLKTIELLPPETPPRERYRELSVICAHLVQQLTWIERDFAVERGTPGSGGRQTERFEKIQKLADIWARWFPADSRPNDRRGLEWFPEATDYDQRRNGRIFWKQSGALHRFISDYQSKMRMLARKNDDHPTEQLWNFQHDRDEHRNAATDVLEAHSNRDRD